MTDGLEIKTNLGTTVRLSAQRDARPDPSTPPRPAD